MLILFSYQFHILIFLKSFFILHKYFRNCLKKVGLGKCVGVVERWCFESPASTVQCYDPCTILIIVIIYACDYYYYFRIQHPPPEDRARTVPVPSTRGVRTTQEPAFYIGKHIVATAIIISIIVIIIVFCLILSSFAIDQRNTLSFVWSPLYSYPHVHRRGSSYIYICIYDHRQFAAMAQKKIMRK